MALCNTIAAPQTIDAPAAPQPPKVTITRTGPNCKITTIKIERTSTFKVTATQNRVSTLVKTYVIDNDTPTDIQITVSQTYSDDGGVTTIGPKTVFSRLIAPNRRTGQDPDPKKSGRVFLSGAAQLNRPEQGNWPETYHMAIRPLSTGNDYVPDASDASGYYWSNGTLDRVLVYEVIDKLQALTVARLLVDLLANTDPPSTAERISRPALQLYVVGNHNFSFFKIIAGDFKQPLAFITTLQTGAPPPLSAWLWSQFLATEQATLLSQSATIAAKATLLASRLNTIIGAVSIYTQARFAGVVLSPETNTWLNSPGPYLNRLLLNDAYPNDFLAPRQDTTIARDPLGRPYANFSSSKDNDATAADWTQFDLDRAQELRNFVFGSSAASLGVEAVPAQRVRTRKGDVPSPAAIGSAASLDFIEPVDWSLIAQRFVNRSAPDAGIARIRTLLLNQGGFAMGAIFLWITPEPERDFETTFQFANNQQKVFNGDQYQAPNVTEMARLRKFLLDNPLVRVRLEGHTDELPTTYPGGNLQLSEDRANKVMQELITPTKPAGATGIAAARFDPPIGHAATQPAVPSNGPNKQTPKNRRVAVRFVSIC